MDTSYLRTLRYKPTCDIIHRYGGGREVVLLGDSAPLRTLLKDKFDIETNMIATCLKESYSQEKNVYPLSFFKGKSDLYYIVIPFLQYDEKMVSTLNLYGYKEYNDFVFSMHKPLSFITPLLGYSDEYGNHIDCSAPGLRIRLDPIAGNNHVSVDKSVKFGTDSVLKIGSCENKLMIGLNCSFGKHSRFTLSLRSSITINNFTTAGHNFEIYGSFCSNIKIGEDCMFSRYIIIWSSDGHSIFSTEELSRKNQFFPDESKQEILICDHCWIGFRSAILYNTKIGQSSINGAQSLVKGIFPNNCVITGNPAKVVRKNVTWHRDPYETEINKVDEKYIKLTDENGFRV